MIARGIERRSGASDTDLTEFFTSETRRPVIVTEGFEDWPARKLWSWEFLKSRCYGDIGKFNLSFYGDDLKLLTKVGVFIENLDEPIDAIPGFWLDAKGNPCTEPQDLGRFESGWSFGWNIFRLHPELRSDILPFPACVPNAVSNLPDKMCQLFESICKVSSASLYLTRKGAFVPFHVDFFHTFGSLFQFEGRKDVWLFGPAAGLDNILPTFDPLQPDFSPSPALSETAIFSATMQPGELLIIPPDWWHCTRAIDHSMTLSCNFLNEFNESDFMACFLSAAPKSNLHEEYPELLDRLTGGRT